MSTCKRAAALAAMTPEERAMVERAEGMAVAMMGSLLHEYGRGITSEELLNAIGNLSKMAFCDLIRFDGQEQRMAEYDRFVGYTRQNIVESMT